jgi:hypothetical protein
MLRKIILAIIFLIVILSVTYYLGGFKKGTPPVVGDVVVFTPTENQIITSPLQVTGKARGTWFFEANIIIRIKDANGNTLALKGMNATEDWMTTNYVNFTGSIEFSKPSTATGFLVIESDNPSGDPQQQKKFDLPLRFE